MKKITIHSSKYVSLNLFTINDEELLISISNFNEITGNTRTGIPLQQKYIIKLRDELNKLIK